MRMSTIFREAARRIERGLSACSCIAVSQVSEAAGLEYFGRARAKYQRLMSPRGDGYLGVNDFYPDRNTSRQEARNHRVLALCMAATLADEEGL